MSKNFYTQYKLPIDNKIPYEKMPVRFGRELAYLIACRAGNIDCLRDANVLGGLDVNDTLPIPRGLEDPVFCNYFKLKSVEYEWNNVFQRMNKLQQNVDYTFKTNLINALACTNNSTFLYNLLESSLDSSPDIVNYTQSDRRNVFNAVLRNAKGIETAIKLIDLHGQSNALGDNFGWSWQRILLNIADVVYTEEEQIIFQTFIERFEHPDVTTNVLERAKTASTANSEAQLYPENVRQMALITDILEKTFGETTPAPTTTGPSITPPDSANVAHISLLLVICLASFTIKF
jgi:ERAP1-like C-terminal domain